MMVNVVSWYNV